jgi:predicted ester cyclase
MMVEDQNAEGDIKWGVPATGKQSTFTIISINRLIDGKIVADWFEVDMAGVQQQLSTGDQ